MAVREFSRIQEAPELTDVNSMLVRAASTILEEYGWPIILSQQVCNMSES